MLGKHSVYCPVITSSTHKNVKIIRPDVMIGVRTPIPSIYDGFVISNLAFLIFIQRPFYPCGTYFKLSSSLGVLCSFYCPNIFLSLTIKSSENPFSLSLSQNSQSKPTRINQWLLHSLSYAKTPFSPPPSQPPDPNPNMHPLRVGSECLSKKTHPPSPSSESPAPSAKSFSPFSPTATSHTAPSKCSHPNAPPAAA